MLFFVVVVVLGLFLFFCFHNLTDPPKNDSDRPGMAGVEFTAATWCVRDYFIFLGGEGMRVSTGYFAGFNSLIGEGLY